MNTNRWAGLELRYLVALEAVGREGSFHRAAERLGYTQSAVSQQIAALERIVGTPLFNRPGGPRPVTLTEAGALLLPHAEGIVARVAAAQADLDALTEGSTGVLRVGSYQSVGARILPAVMRAFAAGWPRVEVRLWESADDGELLGLVERGELDLTFMIFPIPDGPFEAVELLRDPFVLVVPADSPLARRGEPPSMRQLAELPLIAYRARRRGDQTEALLASRGEEPRVVFRSDDNGTIHGLVAAGVGVALIPRLSAQPGHPDTRAIELGARFPPRVIGIARHRHRYRVPAADAFLETARDVCQRLDEAAGDA